MYIQTCSGFLHHFYFIIKCYKRFLKFSFLFVLLKPVRKKFFFSFFALKTRMKIISGKNTRSSFEILISFLKFFKKKFFIFFYKTRCEHEVSELFVRNENTFKLEFQNFYEPSASLFIMNIY